MFSPFSRYTKNSFDWLLLFWTGDYNNHVSQKGIGLNIWLRKKSELLSVFTDMLDVKSLVNGRATFQPKTDYQWSDTEKNIHAMSV